MEKIRVLVVDDEERSRTTLAQLLGRRGVDADTAGSGPEALLRLGEREYDVVLLDMKMPGVSGLDVLPEIRRVQPLVEVIVLTGHASVDHAVEITRRGGSDYLLKPCPTDELCEKIMLAHDRKLERAKAAPPGGGSGGAGG